MDAQALWLTLRLAFTTTLLLIIFSIPVAWWIASSHSSFRTVVQALTAIPLVLPPTVIGYYLLVGLSPRTILGGIITKALGHPLAFSFAGLLVGSMLYSLPFSIQPLVTGFRAIEPRYLEAAAGLGVSSPVIFRKLVLPLAYPSLLAAIILTFTHTIGEFGIVLMLGGNIPGLTRTLSIVLYDQVQDFNYPAANRTAALLVLFALACLILIYGRLSRRPTP